MNAWRSGAMSLGKFIEFAKEVGADGIEILDAFFYEPGVVRDHLPSEEVTQKLLEEAATALQFTGLKVHAIAITNDFNFSDTNRLRIEREKIDFGLSLARQFHAPVVRVFSGNPTSSDDVELVRYRTIDALKDFANPDTLLALENHGSVFAGPSRLKSILEPIDDSQVGLCFDVGNFLLADVDPLYAAWELPAPALIHVKDFQLAADGPYRSNSGKHYKGCRLGEGVVPLKECLDVLLQKVGDQEISIDLELECGDDGIDATRHGVDWVRNYLTS
jgi:sugar phosphate isomerase/epimerase